jgi:hypothetical protein
MSNMKDNIKDNIKDVPVVLLCLLCCCCWFVSTVGAQLPRSDACPLDDGAVLPVARP